jgi:hypothetical protein
MKWFRACRCADGLSSASPMEPLAESPPKASIPHAEVPEMSPARLLARSLTDCETRDEWMREDSPLSYISVAGGYSQRYVNKARNLYVSRYTNSFGETIHSNFPLNKTEQKIVIDALDRFERRKAEEAEKAALARLIAPCKGLQRDSGETAQTGSTRRAKARPQRGASK